MSLTPDLSIVIVNYNTKDYTAQCIDSLYRSPPQIDFEIILIDNASTDGGDVWLEQRFPDIVFIRSPQNVGIAGGNNLGIRASKGSFVLLLNNDTVVAPGSIDRAVEFLKVHVEAGGAGGNLLNEDGTFQSGHYHFPTFWIVFLITTKIGEWWRPYFPSNPRGQEVKEVDWMSTAFMVFRRETLFEVGLVDEGYFIYSDESDLQYRIKKRGWKIYYLPDLVTIHFGGKSLNPWRRRRLVYRGYLLFFSKHRSVLESLLLRMLFILASSIKLIIWGLILIVGKRRDTIRKEIDSNLSILKMCMKPGIEAV